MDKTTNAQKYLKMMKAKLGGVSDYRIAKEIGVTTSSVSRWKLGYDSFSPKTAQKVAEILEIDFEVVLIDAQLDRCKLPEDTAIWKNLLNRITATGTTIAVACLLAFPTPEAQASTLKTASENPSQFVLCKILSLNVFHIFASFAALFSILWIFSDDEEFQKTFG